MAVWLSLNSCWYLNIWAHPKFMIKIYTVFENKHNGEEVWVIQQVLFSSWPYHSVCKILVPRSGIESNHWTTMEFPGAAFVICTRVRTPRWRKYCISQIAVSQESRTRVHLKLVLFRVNYWHLKIRHSEASR